LDRFRQVKWIQDDAGRTFILNCLKAVPGL
jgi:hypothetical protein